MMEEKLGVTDAQIIKSCSLAVKSHKSISNNGYIKESGSEETIFDFGESWADQDFYTHEPFGEITIDASLFPSLKSVGNNEPAKINQGFFRRFQAVLQTPNFQGEVEKAIKKAKPIIFTGHSSGGPVAILAAVWYLEKYTRSGGVFPCKCITFGSPLVGERIFTHALNRENWARFFLHFVGRYDIVPRITLAPYSSLKTEFCQILDFFNPKSRNFKNPSILNSQEALIFFKTVLKNASSVASHAACNLMGSTNSLLEIVCNFVELSPYKPSGTFIFCTGNGKLVCVKNPNAVLQILFYSCQPSDESEVRDAASRSLYMDYNKELEESLLGMQDVVYLDEDDDMEIPLSANVNASGDTASINTALKDLGLSTRARLCLRAAQAFEKKRLEYQKTIDSKIPSIIKMQEVIADYQKSCKDREIGYYDAFKIQKGTPDFNANVKRLELAGIWDEIVEMLKRYELPDGFESRAEWIELGTKFRKLVEPLDIANYYRHSKDEDTGTYLRDGGRPKRYKYTQRWHEHAHRLIEGSSSETIFWAKVEELKRKPFGEVKDQIVALEKQVSEWIRKGELENDVFLEKSTFVMWWKILPQKHRSESCLRLQF